MIRKPNTKCNICSSPIYRRPFEQKIRKRKFYCKECAKKYDKKWYSDNNSDRKEQLKKHKIDARNRNRLFIMKYLKNHPCLDCGEVDPIVLEFDHKENKEYNVSEMVRGAFSIKAIEKEINKCEVRCANCHRRKTMKEIGCFKLGLPNG